MFTPLKNLLPQTANRFQMGTTLKAIDVCYKAKEILRKLLPEETHAFIAPKYYKDRTLTVAVKEPIYAQEVMMRKGKIIKELNEIFKMQVIQDIKTQLSNFSLDEGNKAPLD